MGNFYHQLGRIQPITYVLLYIFMIFAFAAAYGSLPTGSFFHATMQHERGNMLSEAQALLSSLEGSIQDAFVKRYSASVTEINGWSVNINELDLQTIDLKEYTESSMVTITGSIPIRRGTEVSDTVLANLPLSLRTNLSRGFRMITNYSDPSTRTITLFDTQFVDASWPDADVLPAPPRAGQLLSTGFDQVSSSQQGGASDVFAIPGYLHERLVDFGSAYRGFPGRNRGQFERMVYLSSGIATSSALGDIVPVTNLARSVVTLQSLACIVVVALFLDSVTRRIVVRRETGAGTAQ